jgi:hypothetical protein
MDEWFDIPHISTKTRFILIQYIFVCNISIASTLPSSRLSSLDNNDKIKWKEITKQTCNHVYRELASWEVPHRRSQALKLKTYTQTDTHPITSGFVTLHLITIQFCWFCLRSGICLVVLNNQSSYLSFFPYCCYKHRVWLFTRPRVFLSSTTVTFNSQLLWFSFSLYFFSPLYFLHRSPVFFFFFFFCLCVPIFI